MLRQETESGKYTLYLFGAKTVLNEDNDTGFEGNVFTETYVVAIKLPGGSGKTVTFGNYVKESSNALDADETIFVVMGGKAADGQTTPDYDTGITMTMDGTTYTLNVVGMTALPE